MRSFHEDLLQSASQILEQNRGREGYGTDALRTLAEHLGATFVAHWKVDVKLNKIYLRSKWCRTPRHDDNSTKDLMKISLSPGEGILLKISAVKKRG